MHEQAGSRVAAHHHATASETRQSTCRSVPSCSANTTSAVVDGAVIPLPDEDAMDHGPERLHRLLEHVVGQRPGRLHPLSPSGCNPDRMT